METTATPGFSLLRGDKSDSPPPEQVHWPMNVSQGANWILPPWGPYRWVYHIFQWWVRYFVSTSPRLLPWYPWPRHPYSWPSPHFQISLTLRRSSEWMQCSLPNPGVAILLLYSWDQGRDQKCVVSLFSLMTSASKHDKASLIIEWSDVTQHMHICLLRH